MAVRVSLGDRVEAGALVIELDDTDTRLALEHESRRLESLDAVIASHEREIAAEREALEALERAAGAAASEARARVDAAVAEARLAESQLAESQVLEQAEVASASELRRSEAEADRLHAATRELKSASTRERLDAAREAADRLANIVTIEADIASLEAELEHHRLRAPVAGVVGELEQIERGSWVERGEVVGMIVPNGELEVVAEFEPAQAIGRIKPGQPARLRLAGFPWAQYGTVGARVDTVASEAREGALKVELTIESVPPTITLEHGLPGSIEVQIERTSPANLLLRAAGRRLSGAHGES